jgi:hypothetical protein
MTTPPKNSTDNTSALSRMQQLYGRLSRVKFSPKFLRDYVFPPDWQDENADSDTEYRGLLAFLSTHLGIDPSSLDDPTVPIVFGGSTARLFRGRDIFEEPDATQQIAQGVASVILSGFPVGKHTYIPPALVLRRQLLLEGKPWIGFRDLLSYCWRIRVPVLHVQNLPAKSTKHKGIAVEVGGAPAIVLCQQHVSPAWHLKALAHEMGHLTREDADLMSRRATTEEQVRIVEQAETAAIWYSTQVITGGREVSPDTRQYQRIQELVDATYEQAYRQNIDPGYLILRRGAVTKRWPEANVALQMIDDREGGASARELINNQVSQHTDVRHIHRESLLFFQRMTGVQLHPFNPSEVSIGVTQSLPSSVPISSTTEARPSIYPDELLRRYKALTRQRRIGGLSGGQEKELVGLREQIQAISRRDEHGQEALRRVEEVNAALTELEMAVDTRIALRGAEMAERHKD